MMVTATNEQKLAAFESMSKWFDAKDGIRAYHEAVRAYGKDNIAKGRAARKLDHALSALICLTPEERRGFLYEAESIIKELESTGPSIEPAAKSRATARR